MRLRSFILFLFFGVILIPGCGSGNDRTPTETVKGFLDLAIQNGKPSEAEAEFCTEKAGKAYRELAKHAGDNGNITVISAKYGEEKIDGDKATVKVITAEKSGEKAPKSESIYHLEKEGGKWGIVGMQREGMEKMIRFDGEEFAKMISMMKAMNEATNK